MASDWAITKFEDVLAVPLRNGLTRPKAVRGSGVKMVNMGELFAHSRIRNVDMDRVPLSGDEATKYLLEPGDLLFARQSLVLSGAGKCSIFLDADEPITFEGHLIRARINSQKADPAFFYYFFGSNPGRQAIESIVEQVAAAGIRGSDLAKLEVPLPPLPEQRAIASILGALDDKIELNRRMNRTLEAMAQALFQSWFVDFDPVRAKAEGRDPGLPAEIADLFAEGFEDSELGEIPQGWRIGCIGGIADNLRRTIQPHGLEATVPYIGLEHMPRRSIALSEWGQAEELASNKYEFRRGEILFGKLRPYFHKVGVAPIDGICSTDILVITPEKPVWFSFLLGHISSEKLVNHTDASSTGTKMPRTNWQDMARYQVVLPPEPIAAAFNAHIKPLISRMIAGIHESRTLAALRDTLLPRLLSGELRVGEERSQA
jgi:type I restriction enzyme S subunit